MDLEKIGQFIDSLYGDISTSSVSLAGREKLNLNENSNYVYGDITFPGFYDMLQTVAPQPGEVFYDLGSGAGKAVLLAALAFPFAKSAGVEFVDDLFELAKSVSTKLQEQFPAIAADAATAQPNINFVHDDFTTADISDARVVYSHATCFDPDLIRRLTTHLEEQLKPGARIITVTKQLAESPKFKLLKQSSHPMSWGQATTWFYEKIA